MYEEHLLPPATRLLHIGPPKTGTTAVQSAFAQARTALHEHGAYYAGPGSRPREAVTALTRPTGKAPADTAAWDELVAEVQGAGDLRVCISNERFATSDQTAATRAVSELGGDRAHVVMVARPLDALLPSQWQQRVRKRRSMISYDEWLRIVLGDRPDGEHYEHFWVLHDLADQIGRWTRAAATDRVTVVVSEENNRDFLPRLFEGLMGLPEQTLVPSKSWSNRSLDFAEAELMRALDHKAEARGWDRDLYERTLKPAISSDLRATTPTKRAPILLPEWARGRVNELNEQRRDLLLGTDVRVIGQPESQTERLTAIPVTTVDSPDEVTVTVDLAIGVLETVVSTLATREKRLTRRVKRQQRRLAALRVRSQAGGPGPNQLRSLAGRLKRRLRRRG